MSDEYGKIIGCLETDMRNMKEDMQEVKSEIRVMNNGFIRISTLCEKFDTTIQNNLDLISTMNAELKVKEDTYRTKRKEDIKWFITTIIAIIAVILAMF